MEKIPVVVHTDKQVLTGNVLIPVGRRLSDFLNNELNNKSEQINPFLKMSDVTLSYSNGNKRKADTIYINKDTIQLIRTAESDLARGIGAREGPKLYPYVHKSKLRAEIITSHYEISGYLHCASEEAVSDLFTQQFVFIPCTDTLIHDAKGTSSLIKAGFVVINKKQVFSFSFRQDSG